WTAFWSRPGSSPTPSVGRFRRRWARPAGGVRPREPRPGAGPALAGRRDPRGIEQTGEDVVLPPALDHEVVPGISLDREAETLQDGRTRRVVRNVVGRDPVQVHLPEHVVDAEAESARHQAR